MSSWILIVPGRSLQLTGKNGTSIWAARIVARPARADACVLRSLINTRRIDEAVLALLYLGLHERNRAWKGFDWDAMGRLNEKGFITDPVGE